MKKINLILILFFLFPLPSQAFKSSIEGTIIVESQKGIITYSVRKRQISSPALLDHFGKLVESEGRHAGVTVLFEDEISLNVITNLRGIINKAGIGNIQYYSYNPETRMMIEIIFKGKAMPVPTE